MTVLDVKQMETEGLNEDIKVMENEALEDVKVMKNEALGDVKAMKTEALEDVKVMENGALEDNVNVMETEA